MIGRIFVVEGASGSGKDTLLERLTLNKDFMIMRGVASQNPAKNIKLTPKGQEIYAGRPISLELMLYSSTPTRQDVLNRYIKIAGIQLDEAICLKHSGKSVIMNRSIISAITHLEIIIEKKPFEEKEWLDGIVAQSQSIYEKFIKEVNGIILMEEPIKGVEKVGIAGLQNLESEKINSKVSIVYKMHNVPLLRLNANRITIDEEEKLAGELLSSLT